MHADVNGAPPRGFTHMVDLVASPCSAQTFSVCLSGFAGFRGGGTPASAVTKLGPVGKSRPRGSGIAAMNARRAECPAGGTNGAGTENGASIPAASNWPAPRRDAGARRAYHVRRDAALGRDRATGSCWQSAEHPRSTRCSCLHWPSSCLGSR